jgi:hypothetical protein
MWMDETPECVIEASGRRFRIGLLAVTTTRLLYVEERFVPWPARIDIKFTDIASFATRHEPGGVGTLDLQLADGDRRVFRMLSPLSQLEPFVTALATHAPDAQRTNDVAPPARLPTWAIYLAGGVAVAAIFLGTAWAENGLNTTHALLDLAVIGASYLVVRKTRGG